MEGNNEGEAAAHPFIDDDDDDVFANLDKTVLDPVPDLSSPHLTFMPESDQTNELVHQDYNAPDTILESSSTTLEANISVASEPVASVNKGMQHLSL